MAFEFNHVAAKKIAAGLIAALLIAPLLAGCTAAGDPTAGLVGPTWTLVSLNGSPAITGATITATFADGQVGGSAGCNSYGGNYTLNGAKLSFGPIMSTMMACPQPAGVMDQEQAYLAALQSGGTFAIQGGQLTFTAANGSTLIFK
jgi:heat shock protein HslJ